jgi:hypothetical protein
MQVKHSNALSCRGNGDSICVTRAEGIHTGREETEIGYTGWDLMVQGIEGYIQDLIFILRAG